MASSQGKKKNRGKTAELDTDDLNSEVSFDMENGPAAVSKKKGKKGKKGAAVDDDDEFDISAFDGKNTEPSASVDENGAVSKKKGKKGKKGLAVDDDEYDVSNLDDDKSVQSTESLQSRDGSKRGKKGKQSAKGRVDDDEDEFVDNVVNSFPASNKGNKKSGSTNLKASTDFSLLDELGANEELVEDESAVDELESVDKKLKQYEKQKPQSGKQDTNSVKQIDSISDEDVEVLSFAGKKKSKGKKGSKVESISFAALDTLDDAVDTLTEDTINKIDDPVTLSGKKKPPKTKLDEVTGVGFADTEDQEGETTAEKNLDEDTLVFSGKKKSKGKKKTTDVASGVGFAMLEDQLDDARDADREESEEDALVFTGKKKSKKSKGLKKAEEDEYQVPNGTQVDHVEDGEDVLTFSGKKKSKSKKGLVAVPNDSTEQLSLPGDLNGAQLSSSLQNVEVRESDEVLQFSGKKKGKKGKKAVDDADIDAILAELDGPKAPEVSQAVPLVQAEPEEVSVDASNEADEVLQFTGKKKGKKGKKVVDDADIDAILAELDGPKVTEVSQFVPPVQEESKVVSVDASNEPQKVEDSGTVSKKKGKKGKKNLRTAQEDEDLDAILAELDAPKPEKQPASDVVVEQVQETTVQEPPPPEGGDEAEVVESAAAKKKKKKKEKEKAAKAAGKQLEQEGDVASGDKQEVSTSKSKIPDKKVPKHVREMQERLAKQKEAEERQRKEEEERRRKEEEEQRRLEELEREREEAKRRRKEREKEKLLKKKQEGKLLTGKQKEEAKRLALMREQLLSQKPSLDLDSSVKEEAVPKKPKYDHRKKKRPQVSEPATVTEQPVEEAEPLPTSEITVQNEAVDEVEVAQEVSSEVVAIEEEAVEAEEEGEDEGWDAKSWDSDNIELPPVKSAFAEDEADELPTAVTASKKAKTVANQASQVGSVGKQAAPPERVEQVKQESEEEESESEEETESEEDDSIAKRKREAAQKRASRKAEALAKRSADDLRSPICCILGHVDTGKTKLLDCIRRTNVQEGEAGGITQQIGATYFPRENIIERTKDVRTKVEMKVPGLLVIDTPGHESFTNLRSRGSGLCDIAILVVDIMHGLEPQTIESLNLLKMRHTPFVVALNKVDRLYSWKSCPNAPITNAFEKQSRDVMNEFDRRLNQIITQIKEQGLNSELYYKNPDRRKYVSIVPTSAISGEGVPDLLMLLVTLTQQMMESKLMYISEVQCTVLEVKVVEGLGTTIDVILVNGVLHEGDQIVVCGMQGPIVTTIRALLTPHPMKEIRVKYLHHKELKAAQGIKLTAQGLEHAIAGTQLHVVGPDDDLEDIKEEAMEDMKNVMSRVDKSGEGVCVQASTLGSLEALLEFLKSPAVKIPVSGISIGPVHKRDVMRASVMLERKKKEYATILAFDVKVTPEAKDLAEELGVRIFTADIIYHLFDQFTAYMDNVKEEKRKESADEAVFPCVLRIKPEFVFNKKDPIIVGVDVIEGIARVGTPICVPSQEMIDIGRIASMEVNHKVVDTAKKGQAVAMKITGTTPEEIQKMYGRHFDHQDELVSHITRRSIDVLKENFRDELSVEEWKLVVKLKKLFNIP
ncbi:hypothetical protein KP509_31G051600 [Ceratopteris richardii]|uniref:Eukaryotic translation initiation factor 5B n=1 Tax=Ceratopteris richardii TaxID=49495 RepID=A0A8T2QXT4_CERRI|nr:hypothetical protein KP509_31G051600 [Ceratopteris richardii]